MYDVFKILDLSKYGWEGCSLKFRSFTLGDAKEFTKLSEAKPDESTAIVLEVLQKYFVEGDAMKDGVKVKVEKGDLLNLPIEIIQDILKLYNTQIDEKKKSE